MRQLVTIKKADTKKQVVYGEVYSPNTLDTQNDFMSAEVIEKMAWDFMRRGVKEVDVEHDRQPVNAHPVESFVARPGDPDFAEGSWVLGIHIPDKSVWAKVEKNEINAFSMWGTGQRERRVVEVDIPDDGIVRGTTLLQKDEDGHAHEFELRFSPDTGRFLGGVAKEGEAGHSHSITKGTVTEAGGEDGHTHRFLFTHTVS